MSINYSIKYTNVSTKEQLEKQEKEYLEFERKFKKYLTDNNLICKTVDDEVDYLIDFLN